MSKWSKVKRGWRTIDGQKIYFDSRAEVNCYLYLNWLLQNKQIQSFEYHPKYFDFSQWIKHGVTRYEVDFKVTELDGREWYIEVKSTNRIDKMDSQSRTKIKRLAKYYPEIRLKIMSTNEIQKLNLGIFITSWEY